MTAIESLADFSHSLHLSDVPAPVRRQAALSLLDVLGCMAAGAATADAAMMLGAEHPDDRTGSSTVVGMGRRLPAREAARCNGYFGDIFELNDLTGGHAGIGTVPAALALARSRARRAPT